MKTWKELSSTYLAVTEEETPEKPRSIWWRLGAAAALPGLVLIGCGGSDASLAASGVSGDENGDGVDDTATATATGLETATATATDAGPNTEDSLDTTGGTDTGHGDDTTGHLMSPA